MLLRMSTRRHRLSVCKGTSIKDVCAEGGRQGWIEIRQRREGSMVCRHPHIVYGNHAADLILFLQNTHVRHLHTNAPYEHHYVMPYDLIAAVHSVPNHCCIAFYWKCLAWLWWWPLEISWLDLCGIWNAALTWKLELQSCRHPHCSERVCQIWTTGEGGCKSTFLQTSLQIAHNWSVLPLSAVFVRERMQFKMVKWAWLNTALDFRGKLPGNQLNCHGK